MNYVRLPFYAKFALVLLSLGLVLALMYFGKNILIPLFAAFLIAVLLHPLVKRMENLRFPRSLASILAVIFFLALVSGLVYFFSHQLVHFSRDMPHLQKRFTARLQHIQEWISENYNINDSAQINYFNRSTAAVTNDAVASVARTFLGAVRLIILAIFLLIFTFFVLLQRKGIMEFVLALFRGEHSRRVQGIVRDIYRMIHSYVLGLLIEMLVLGILIYVALLVLGIKYALLIAVTGAMLNIIPYLGIYAAMIIGMLITLANGNGSQVLGLGIVFVVAHFIDANVILPRIVGGQVKLNPLVTILAVLAGNLVWGIPGMFLFIPIMAILRIVSEEVAALQPWAVLLGAQKRTGRRRRVT